jgi:hypothetical protein
VYIWLVSGMILFPVEIGSDNGWFVIWDKNRDITEHLSRFAWFLSCIPAKNNHDLRFNYVKPTIVILPTDYPHNGPSDRKKRNLDPGTPVIRKAILAIDGSALGRLKRNFTILLTI